MLEKKLSVKKSPFKTKQMKNLFIASVLVCFSGFSYSQGWSLVWEDEFSGTTLDQSKWTHALGTGSQNGLWGWGNGELPGRVDAHVTIQGSYQSERCLLLVSQV